MPGTCLRIALIEPDPACAAELGQLLSETLRDFSFELSDAAAADLVLIDETAPPPSNPLVNPTILFARSNASYLARALSAQAEADQLSIPLAMPLTDSIRCAALLRQGWQTRADLLSQTDSASNREGQLQRRLLQLQKMEAVAELAGGIAHDFNNLLLVICSYAEMLVEEPGQSPAASHYAREIVGAAKRASQLNGELLAFSRRQPLQLKPTNLNSVIDSAVPMLSRLVGKNIAVWVQLPVDLWPIQADSSQLEQVLVNLAANARDAMPRGGKLLLETSNVKIEDQHAAMPPGEYVMISVSDTGLGIPKHVLPRIFEPFFTTKERGKGTGLGLASVYGIVKHSGGYIWAYSESGYGTTFKIYLPRAAAVIFAPEEPAPKLAARAASNSMA